MTTATSLIINSAFVVPQRYPAGYEILDARENTRHRGIEPLKVMKLTVSEK